MDKRETEWYEAMKAKGHMPRITEGGELNVFVLDFDYHNGPGCAACDWSCCWYCEEISDIPECDSIELETQK